ncbi:uncharacterized protein [Centruroides vittatus]|uniref:uncharacterized protein n=1 Tax=Centruroides vittatus TaxID=120091 RepID=UPI00351026C7
MVEAADLMLSPYIFLVHMFTVPCTCVVLRYLIFSELSNIERVTLINWIISLLLVCIAITLISGKIVVNAHEPEQLLHEIMNRPLNSFYKLQINLFLQRLHGPPIGLTCLGIFVVTYGTLYNIFSMIASYLLMYVQYSKSN